MQRSRLVPGVLAPRNIGGTVILKEKRRTPVRFIRSYRAGFLRSSEKLFAMVQSIPRYRSFMRRHVPVTGTSDYDDLPYKAVIRLQNEYKDIGWLKGNKERTFIFVLIGNRYAGFARLDRYENRPEFGKGVWLMDCWIRPVFRGLGAGERLIDRVIGHARETGSGEVSLFVFRDNQRAISFYRKLGFKEIEIPELKDKILKGYKRPFNFMRISLDSFLPL